MEDQKKLAIAIVCDPYDDKTAGVIVSTDRFARALSARGHHVVVIASRSQKHATDTQEYGVSVRRLPSVMLPFTDGQWYISFPSARRLQNIFREEHIEVVHIVLPLPSSVSALKAARVLGIATVAHSHSQPENVLLHLPSFVPKQFLMRPYYAVLTWLYRKADRVICVSPLGKELLIHAGMNPHQLDIVSNGVDSGRFHPIDASDVRRKLGIPNTARVLLFVGRLMPEKSVDTLVRAMPQLVRRFPNIVALIIGGGTLSSSLQRLARSLGVADRIMFAGRIPDADLAAMYNVGDVFVLPSLAELEGMVVLEAMACGKPLLIANAPGSAARFFVTDNGFLFRPRDPDDLARQAAKVLDDDAVRVAMGQASVRASRQYDFDESVRQLERVYLRVMKKE